MDTFINTSTLGVFTYVCAGDYQPMKTVGFALIMFGMIGATITYQHLKERIEKLEKQYKINFTSKEKYNIIERVMDNE